MLDNDIYIYTTYTPNLVLVIAISVEKGAGPNDAHAYVELAAIVRSCSRITFNH